MKGLKLLKALENKSKSSPFGIHVKPDTLYKKIPDPTQNSLQEENSLKFYFMSYSQGWRAHTH